MTCEYTSGSGLFLQLVLRAGQGNGTRLGRAVGGG
jgi:hypothetical protein